MARMTDEEVKEIYFNHLMEWSKHDLAYAILRCTPIDQIREELKAEAGFIECVDGIKVDLHP